MTMRPVLPALFLLLAAAAPPPAGGELAAPPVTRRDEVKETLHGVTLVDPYRWLEDQGAPETRAWIDAQNKYAHALLDPLPVRGAIRDRLTALARQDAQWAPTERAGRYFILKRRAGRSEERRVGKGSG